MLIIHLSQSIPVLVNLDLFTGCVELQHWTGLIDSMILRINAHSSNWFSVAIFEGQRWIWQKNKSHRLAYTMLYEPRFGVTITIPTKTLSKPTASIILTSERQSSQNVFNSSNHILRLPIQFWLPLSYRTCDSCFCYSFLLPTSFSILYDTFCVISVYWLDYAPIFATGYPFCAVLFTGVPRCSIRGGKFTHANGQYI